MMDIPFFISSLALLSGVCFGVLSFWLIQKVKIRSFNVIANDIIQRSEIEAETIKNAALLAAKQIQIENQQQQELSRQNERKNFLKQEERLKVREDKLENRMHLVEKKLAELEKREALISTSKEKLEEEKRHLQGTQKKLIAELELISGLSSIEAKDTLINRIASEVKKDAANFIRRAKKQAEEEADNEATRIIATSINRLASSAVSEVTVCTVALPNEEMKGRIIGREGRNIRALERATGVNFIIDDTPGAIVLSGFDPIRKHVAKIAISELILDGRIHPTRIEETVEKSLKAVQKQIYQYGEDAALRVGAMNLHPELITLLGRLKFRFSLGQNVLDHSIEVAHLMGLMAGELSLDIRLAKRIGLLHDIGKALTHEIEGSHALIGHDYALKFGETKEVANGIGCHHQELEPITIEGSLCSAADAISASRPGARIEAVEEYIRRLKKLEDIALDFEGVEKAYAMQAGREIRVIVLPDAIDDDGLVNVARNLTKRIENELDYPGKIKVTVIREKKAVEYAF
ncbi:Ribonuclease Y [Chlamydiales bacterium STE3]|nr:Ribonuclease Y [Chlamydiales bacterium STE3]